MSPDFELLLEVESRLEELQKDMESRFQAWAAMAAEMADCVNNHKQVLLDLQERIIFMETEAGIELPDSPLAQA